MGVENTGPDDSPIRRGNNKMTGLENLCNITFQRKALGPDVVHERLEDVNNVQGLPSGSKWKWFPIFGSGYIVALFSLGVFSFGVCLGRRQGSTHFVTCGLTGFPRRDRMS